MVDHSANPGAHPHADRGDDLYETPPEAVHALLDNEALPGCIWEPACGPGAIVRVLRGYGKVVYATDLNDYNSPDQDQAGWDFLTQTQLPIGAGAIVTNPPYRLANQFVRKALELSPITYMLLRLPFLEGVGRSDILDSGELAKVILFRNRLPMMHRAGWEGPKSTSSMAFAWYKWDVNHVGPAKITRISWTPLPKCQ